MRIISRFIAIASLASFGLSQQAAAATLYDNGPISSGTFGDLNLWTTNNVVESFTLSSASTVTGVTFGSWVYEGNGNAGPSAPYGLGTVDWLITTVPYGAVVLGGSGTASPTSTYVTSNNNTWNIYSSNFSTGSISLAAGTYYLELTNGTNTNPNNVNVGWDINCFSGSGTCAGSTTYINGTGPYNGDPRAAYELSFQILGDVNTVPLPAALPLFASGLGALGLLGWRRKRKAAAAIAA